MKNLLLISFLAFVGCASNSNKIVETEKETAECLIGKWKPEDPNQQPYITYEFNADIVGNKIENRHFTVKGVDNKGESREDGGNWDIKSPRIIRANLGFGSGISIELTNCNRFVARGKRIYIKQ